MRVRAVFLTVSCAVVLGLVVALIIYPRVRMPKEPVVGGLTFLELKEGISKREVLGLLGEPTTHDSGLVGAGKTGNRMREHLVEKGAVETWRYSKPRLRQTLYIYFDREHKLVSTSIEVTQR